MGIFSRLFGYRWSLYFAQQSNHVRYIMHGDSPQEMLSHLTRYFAAGMSPRPPWSLHLNFNRSHQSILLKPAHFAAGHDGISETLRAELDSIDPKWRNRGGAVHVLDAATNKSIPLTLEMTHEELHGLVLNPGKRREPNLFDLVNDVFRE